MTACGRLAARGAAARTGHNATEPGAATLFFTEQKLASMQERQSKTNDHDVDVWRGAQAYVSGDGARCCTSVHILVYGDGAIWPHCRIHGEIASKPSLQPQRIGPRRNKYFTPRKRNNGYDQAADVVDPAVVDLGCGLLTQMRIQEGSHSNSSGVAPHTNIAKNSLGISLGISHF